MSASPFTLRVLAASAAALALVAAAVGSSRPASGTAVGASSLTQDIESEADHVDAQELGRWIRARKSGLRVLDVRTDSEFAAYHIPSAQRASLSALSSVTANPGETLVLYADSGTSAVQGWALLHARGRRDVFILRGGLLGWMNDVMNPPLSESDTASARLASLSRYFGGSPRFGAVPSPTAAQAVARQRRRGC